MRVILFGASGMIGRGVLLEALDSPVITEVISVGRRPVDVEHAKLRQIEHADFEHFEALADDFTGLDACFWCLGVQSAGLDEAAYSRITYAYTMAAARVLRERSPGLRFCFVSGAGTDATEKGRTMWARVKGRTENALSAMGFADVIHFRPALIRPMRGSKPRGTAYVITYAILGVFMPLFRLFGGATSTVEIGRAMIAAAQGKSEQKVLDSPAINRLAATV
ncbi:MAG: NAD(P)H-binding protein [Myxococcales bacterium]|nr:NAD(P)H-binding protein [Myxococcales bacterium]